MCLYDCSCIHPSLPPSPLSIPPSSLFSPFQDDFVVLHVLNEYDTVIETPLKTEFLTLLSEKVKTLTQTSLQVTFNRRSVSECIWVISGRIPWICMYGCITKCVGL